MPTPRIVHFEYPADDPAQLAKFYTDLFGWQIAKADLPGPEYWFVRSGDGPGIDGGIMKRVHAQQPIVNYASVDSVDAYLEKAQALGGRVGVPKTTVPGAGHFAIAFDPQGNPIGFWQVDHGAK
jgi:hypothetical protein